MNLQPTIAYLSTRLKNISGVTNVYDALPLTFSPSQLIEFFNESLQAWEISNVAGVCQEGEAGNLVSWTDTIHINGWLKYASDTKALFQQAIDALKVLFLTDPTLGHTVHSHTPLRLVFAQPDYFNNILCHHCRFEFTVTTLIALTNE